MTVMEETLLPVSYRFVTFLLTFVVFSFPSVAFSGIVSSKDFYNGILTKCHFSLLFFSFAYSRLLAVEGV
jgi:hypothetical protein